MSLLEIGTNLKLKHHVKQVQIPDTHNNYWSCGLAVLIRNKLFLKKERLLWLSKCEMSSCFSCCSSIPVAKFLRRRSRYRNRYECNNGNRRNLSDHPMSQSARTDSDPHNYPMSPHANRRIDLLSRSVPDLVSMDYFDRISADGESEIGDEFETEFIYEFINGNQMIFLSNWAID